MNKISVILPTYNRKQLLIRALSSVLNQNMKVDEIIVVDNDSEDGTLEFLKERFTNIVVLSEKKRGVSAARNLGIKKSSNDWIAFLDSDDEWMPEKIMIQSKLINNINNKTKIIHTNEVWLRNGRLLNQKNKHKKRGGYIFSDCLKLCCISPSSVIINKSIFKDHGLFNENLPVCEDYELWVRISSKEEIGFIPKPLVIKHGGHSDQLSRKYWGMDRFRAMALEELLIKKNKFNDFQKQIMISNLIKRIDILLKGARKRNNKNILAKYSPKFLYWSDELMKYRGN